MFTRKILMKSWRYLVVNTYALIITTSLLDKARFSWSLWYLFSFADEQHPRRKQGQQQHPRKQLNKKLSMLTIANNGTWFTWHVNGLSFLPIPNIDLIGQISTSCPMLTILFFRLVVVVFWSFSFPKAWRFLFCNPLAPKNACSNPTMKMILNYHL